MQADATPWHEMLTLSSIENTNLFLKQTKALPWMWKKKKRDLCCFCVLNAVEKQGQCVRWSVRSTYSFTPSGRGFPPGAITVWLIRAGVKKGETSDPHAHPNLQHHRGRGKDQPQSSSGHVPFLSPLIKAATNHRQGDELWYPPPALLTLLALKIADMVVK